MTSHAQAQGHGPTHGEAHGHHRNYVKIWGILLVLLVISVVGPMFGIRVVTLITAFGIALVKAYLVAVNFMHINVEKRYIVYMMTTCLVFLLLFFAGAAPDVMKENGAVVDAGGAQWSKPNFHVAIPAGEHGEEGHGEAGHAEGAGHPDH